MALEHAKLRKLLHRTDEYKRRKELFLEKKREFEKGLTNVAFFNSNDEMIVKKINLDEVKSLPSRHIELNISKSPKYKISNEFRSEIFIENLEKINF